MVCERESVASDLGSHDMAVLYHGCFDTERECHQIPPVCKDISDLIFSHNSGSFQVYFWLKCISPIEGKCKSFGYFYMSADLSSENKNIWMDE